MNDTTELHISRWFDGTPEVLYQAFIDPVQLAQWFGPLAYHVPSASVDIDARPGGHYRMTMVSNIEGMPDSPINSTFTEVVENQLIVGYEIVQGFPGMADGTKLTLTVEFIPEKGGTRLELRQGPLPEQMREMSSVGWGQSFEKLDALLATPPQFRAAM